VESTDVLGDASFDDVSFSAGMYFGLHGFECLFGWLLFEAVL